MKDTKKLIQDLVEINGNKRENLLPIMQGVVDKECFLTAESMREIARQLDIASADVYGTATFYSFLSTTEKGKYVIRVCKTIICDMKEKSEIISAIENFLHIKMGGTTPDKEFSLLETNCLGCCHIGPAMLINDDVYTELTPEKAREILKNYKMNTFESKTSKL